MKLLFDENLSSKLITKLRFEFPGSQHVLKVLSAPATDSEIWTYALENDFTIISKDNDFRQRFFVASTSPNIIWLSVGNANTATIEKLLTSNKDRIKALEGNKTSSLLVLEY